VNGGEAALADTGTDNLKLAVHFNAAASSRALYAGQEVA